MRQATRTPCRMPPAASGAGTARSAAGQERQRAANFYVWESDEAAKGFFAQEMRDRVTAVYGVEPRIEFVEIIEIVDNAHA